MLNLLKICKYGIWFVKYMVYSCTLKLCTSHLVSKTSSRSIAIIFYETSLLKTCLYRLKDMAIKTKIWLGHLFATQICIRFWRSLPCRNCFWIIHIWNWNDFPVGKLLTKIIMGLGESCNHKIKSQNYNISFSLAVFFSKYTTIFLALVF